MLKEGYIEVFVDGTESFIVNSHGFSYEDLTSMKEQMEELEEFEGVESFLYCFKPDYWSAQKDHMGRIEAAGYWEFKEDDYTKEKNKKYRKEFEEFKEFQKEIDGHPEEIEFKF